MVSSTKTNQKKLQYVVEKCHKMQVGWKDHLCHDLFIHKWEVESFETGESEQVARWIGSDGVEMSKQEKYVGDVMIPDGSNKKNIEARTGKGCGIRNKINFGAFQFEVALVWRESFFLSSMLINSQA